MSLRLRIGLLALLALCSIGNPASAAEPNETFAAATVLAPGVLSASDALTAGAAEGPDTYLGTLGLFGQVEFEDDDSSEFGDGRASGLSGVPINPGGTIDFLVTGYDDFGFTGNHNYSGDFEVVVDVYDFFGDFVETVDEIRTLQPGVVEPFSFFGDETWLDGSYDVNIDNLVGQVVGGDVDFFTFTGLTAGDQFAVEVTQESYDGFDSILGWFDDEGELVETDDDGGFDTLSLLEGIVPTSGKLTFAVTGYDDFDFLGEHEEIADYALELTVGKAGDFDGDVDGRDLIVWQRNLSVGALSDWKANYGASMQQGSTSVPEPASAALVGVGLLGLAAFRGRRAF